MKEPRRQHHHNAHCKVLPPFRAARGQHILPHPLGSKSGGRVSASPERLGVELAALSLPLAFHLLTRRCTLPRCHGDAPANHGPHLLAYERTRTVEVVVVVVMRCGGLRHDVCT
ncbi:hypothetical protein E2C01_028797 [Portunus trituberculatus]|uniref:Uncharacterized protein n=1 Tax=Portunus trituberculatus TaxID=210409 RepID=A0A5B7EPP2_PORTR|nr:hypothetical protein [Portunus trituberculatus]